MLPMQCCLITWNALLSSFYLPRGMFVCSFPCQVFNLTHQTPQPWFIHLRQHFYAKGAIDFRICAVLAASTHCQTVWAFPVSCWAALHCVLGQIISHCPPTAEKTFVCWYVLPCCLGGCGFETMKFPGKMRACDWHFCVGL